MGHKYVGLDVHQSSTVAAVQDEKGKSVMESILRTEAEAVRDFLKGLRGTIHVTFEEGTQAAWLYEIVKPVVTEVIVCNPRRNKLLAVGNSLIKNRIESEFKFHLGNIEKIVDDQGREIRKLTLDSFEAMVMALESKDEYTAGHSRRVVKFSEATGLHLGFPAPEMDDWAQRHPWRFGVYARRCGGWPVALTPQP